MKFASTKNEIVRVPFHYDMIDALKTEDNTIWVSIKNICKLLGIDFSSQLRNLKTYPWTCVVIMTTQLEGDQARQVAMIDIESLPMWLSHITPSKVRPEACEKLLKFQLEAKAVLSAWFLGTSATMPELAAEMKEWKRKCIEKEIKIQRLETYRQQSTAGFMRAINAITDLKEEVKAREQDTQLVHRPISITETHYIKLSEYAEGYGVLNKDGSKLTNGQKSLAGRQVSELSRSMGRTYLLGTGLYGMQVLNAWRVQREVQIAVNNHDEAMKSVAFTQ